MSKYLEVADRMGKLICVCQQKPMNRAEALIKEKGAVEAMLWIREINGCTVCEHDYDYEDCLAQDNDCHARAMCKFLEAEAE